MQARYTWRARWFVSALSVALTSGVIVGTESAATAYSPLITPESSVTGTAARPSAPLVNVAAKAAVTKIPAASWPSGVRTVEGAQLELLDQAAAKRHGVNGVLMRLSTTDKKSRKVTAELDYSGFAQAFGGDYGSRLKVVRLSDGATIPSRNDTRTRKISANILAKPAEQLYAVTAAAGGSTGDFKASSLSASATWSVGLQSGDFNWAYPIEVPDMPGGEPDITIGYSSGGIDGRTAATNNQASWLGEGFDYSPGYIERRYRPCSEDGQPGLGDLCWASDNAVLNLPGEGGELVRDDASGQWRSEQDDAWKVELRTGVSNGDNNGEHWVVTDSDGTQYHFGARPAASSAWTVPVFGDDAGEPCNGGSFATSWCQQAYRWMLDYVVDRHGDTVSYFYDTEINNYGRAGNASSATPYVREGRLNRIEYGQGRVVFTPGNRCVGGCAAPSDYPDTPLDLQCDGSSCSNATPAFFSTKRLSKITTQVQVDGVYQDVDSWTFNHTFPATGDGESPTLWLQSIVHSGHTNGTLTLPEVRFDGEQLRNRVSNANGTPLWRWRVNKVVNETGGQTEVTYATAQCSPVSVQANDQRCFPAYWGTDGQGAPTQEYFHKYVVSEVREVDLVAGAKTKVTQYEYVGGAAWHYDDAELVSESRKTYGQLRGWQTVRVRTGDGSDGPQTLTEHVFLRGMDGDKLPDGSRRSITVSDSRGGSIVDSASIRGFARETRVFNGVGGAWVSTTVVEPWTYGPTARRARSAGTLEAYQTDVKATKTWTALSDGSVEITEERKTFDNFGRLRQTEDLGDVSKADDDLCTRVTYAENQSLWIMDTLATLETVGVNCATTASDADVLLAQRAYYDGSTTVGAPPIKGDVTSSEQLSEINAGTRTYVQQGHRVYDAHGRVIESYDPSGDKTTTTYTPVSGKLASLTLTNSLGHAATTTYDPLRGHIASTVDANGRKIEFAYDALGRVTGKWLPGRVKGSVTANAVYEYLVRNNAPSVITTKTLTANGSQHAAYTLLDGLLRTRQTQWPSPAGGRIVTDTFYDTHGRANRTNDPYHNTSNPGSTLLTGVSDGSLHGYVINQFDGAGRETDEIRYSLGAEKWRATHSYGGNWTKTVPPAGGTTTMEIVDARDQRIELRQFNGSAYLSTKYSYTKDGRLSTLTDPGGTVWKHFYDLRGREIRVEDPDKGVQTSTFNNENQLTSTTDARGRTLSYQYDALGRRTGVAEGATQLASWEFDSLAGGKGLPVASTRFAGGNAYRNEVVGYDAGGRPTGSAMVIPSSEGALAGRYESTFTYNAAGQMATATQPGVGGLPAETLSFGYNNLGSPTTLTSPLQSYAATSYDNLSTASQVTLGSSGKYLYQSFVVDRATRRLARAVTTRQGVSPSVVSDVNYTYDNAGNITKIADTPSGQAALADVQCFQYDYLRRMTAAWTATDNCAAAPSLSVLGGPAPYWHTYGFDESGNRTSEVQHNGGGDITRNYAVTGHKLNSVTQGSRVDTFAYDATGNTTNRTVNGVSQNLAWDAEGHLASAGSTSFLQDAAGTRLIRRDANGTTLYLGDTELRLEGTVVVGTRYYQHDGSAIAVRKGTELTWQINNHQGTIGYAVKASTLEVTRRYSLPFGGVRGTAPASWTGEKGFVGGVNDPSTGLVHIGARSYDTALGRFISVDPILDENDPQQLNGYSYAENSPITFSDPTGLKTAQKKTTAKTATKKKTATTTKSKPKPDPDPRLIGEKDKQLRDKIVKTAEKEWKRVVDKAKQLAKKDGKDAKQWKNYLNKIPESFFNKYFDGVRKMVGDKNFKKMFGLSPITRDKNGKITGGSTASNTPWCAVFVSYVLLKAGVKAKDLPSSGAAWATNWGKLSGRNRADQKGSLNEGKSTPTAGDIIVYGDPRHSGHVEIVTKVHANGTFDVIGGNLNVGVSGSSKPHPGLVWKQTGLSLGHTSGEAGQPGRFVSPPVRVDGYGDQVWGNYPWE